VGQFKETQLLKTAQGNGCFFTRIRRLYKH